MKIDIKIKKDEFRKKLDIRDGKPGLPGKPGKPGANGSPDTGEEIIDKVNKDKSEKKIKKEKVEGLKELADKVKTVEYTSRLGLRAAGDTVYTADLSAQTNGITKTFTIPAYRRAILLFGSDFPGVFNFTVVPGTITITNTNAPSSGSRLEFLYIM